MYFISSFGVALEVSMNYHEIWLKYCTMNFVMVKYIVHFVKCCNMDLANVGHITQWAAVIATCSILTF